MQEERVATKHLGSPSAGGSQVLGQSLSTEVGPMKFLGHQGDRSCLGTAREMTTPRADIGHLEK